MKTNSVSPDSYLSMEKSKYGRVQISIFTLKISNSDMSGFSFINGKFQFRTCPNFNYGRVYILIFLLQNSKSGHVRISIPDTSGFQFSNCKISNPGASRFRFRTSDSHVGVTGIVWNGHSCTLTFEEYKEIIIDICELLMILFYTLVQSLFS